MSGLFGSASSTAATAANAAQGNISKDVVVQSPPEDSISDLAFSSASDHLAVASWDKKVRIYEIDGQGQSQGRAAYDHQGSVLSCCWSKDGTKLFSGGADKTARMLDIGAGATTAQQIAEHAEPIKCVRAVEVNGNQMLVTGSWDKTIKYWDLRSPQAVATVDMGERVYSLDTRDKTLVVGLSDRFISVVHLGDPTKVFKRIVSPLKWQTRVVACSNDAGRYAIGSIEGRCAINYIDDGQQSSNFSFKCHRHTPPGQPTGPNANSNVYPVNAISFHPEHGTFSTAGSDGTFHFWDGDAKHRLKGYPEVGGSISATAFNRTGNIFAYAVSYDWSKGYAHNNQNLPNKIMLHPVGPDECKPRPAAVKRR